MSVIAHAHEREWTMVIPAFPCWRSDDDKAEHADESRGCGRCAAGMRIDASQPRCVCPRLPHWRNWKSRFVIERAATTGWLDLHRPDGEIVRVKANQIVFVTTAAGMGAATCAQSRLQLLNGFVDVRENVEEVMRFIVMDKSPDGT